MTCGTEWLAFGIGDYGRRAYMTRHEFKETWNQDQQRKKAVFWLMATAGVIALVVGAVSLVVLAVGGLCLLITGVGSLLVGKHFLNQAKAWREKHLMSHDGPDPRRQQ